MKQLDKTMQQASHFDSFALLISASPASCRRLGNVQTTVESGIGIAGKHLFDRA